MAGRWRSAVAAVGLVMLGAAPALGAGQPQPGGAPAAEAAASAPARQWIKVPPVKGRLTARDLGVVINTADPYSVAVGEFYAQARGIAPEHILRIDLPVRSTLTLPEFERLQAQLAEQFGAAGEGPVQAYALAWRQPFAVECQSITGVLALGFDAGLCRRTCAATRASRYFNSPSTRPAADHAMRPSMLLAAADVDSAKALIERGIAADRSLGWRGAPPVVAHFAVTDDKVRSVRERLFPPTGALPRLGVRVRSGVHGAPGADDRVLLYQTGAARLAQPEAVSFVPGALADHLTSFGGWLEGGQQGQTSAVAWIQAGATASYGTVSEPCNHLQKFPHPQVLLLHYLQGSTAIEAYWKSVAWPQQGVFIGEPLSAPYARP